MQEKAFIGTLYQNYMQYLYKCCRKKIGYSTQYNDLIDECIQDTFLLALLNYELLKTHPNVRAWLVTTCMHRLIPRAEQFRFRQTFVAYSLDEVSYNPPLTSHDSDSLTILLQKEFYQELSHALTSDQQQTFKAYFIDQLTMKAIALKSHKTECQIRAQIRAIRSKAKRIVDNM